MARTKVSTNYDIRQLRGDVSSHGFGLTNSRTAPQFEDVFHRYGVDAIVVGGGMLGTTIGGLFRNCGFDTVILDDGEPESGTEASGGMIKPSPLMGLENSQIKLSLDVLERLYGLETEPIILRPSFNLLKTDIYHIEMDKVFGATKTRGKAIWFDTEPHNCVYYQDSKGRLHMVEAEFLVIAAGLGCRELLPGLFTSHELRAKKGMSFHFSGQIEQAFVKFWAPYKQITVHNFKYHGEKVIWAGDGSALTLESWYEGRTAEALKRIREEMGRTDEPLRTVFGRRSFHTDKKRKPCFLERVANKFWIATGSGKFGCISGGWAAHKILEGEGLL